MTPILVIPVLALLAWLLYKLVSRIGYDKRDREIVEWDERRRNNNKVNKQ